MSQPLLSLKKVSYTFEEGRPQEPILSEISFDLAIGESLSLLGSSGIGKTTLCRLMAALLFPSAGEIFFEETKLSYPSSAITISFQNYPCFPWLSVEGNVQFGLKGSQLAVKEGAEYALWLLEQVGLTSVRKAYPHQLSGGMQQRLSLARALVVHPKVLILDEPFSALDSKTKSDLKKLLFQLRAKMGFSLIIVLHDLQDAYSMTDKAIVLSGKPTQVRLQIATEDIDFPEFKQKVLASIHSALSDLDPLVNPTIALKDDSSVVAVLSEKSYLASIQSKGAKKEDLSYSKERLL